MFVPVALIIASAIAFVCILVMPLGVSAWYLSSNCKTHKELRRRHNAACVMAAIMWSLLLLIGVIVRQIGLSTNHAEWFDNSSTFFGVCIFILFISAMELLAFAYLALLVRPFTSDSRS